MFKTGDSSGVFFLNKQRNRKEQLFFTKDWFYGTHKNLSKFMTCQNLFLTGETNILSNRQKFV